MTRDWETSSLDAAEAFESARGWRPSRRELAEEQGYDPYDDTLQPTKSTPPASPEIADLVRRAGMGAERLRERDREWRARNGRAS